MDHMCQLPTIMDYYQLMNFLKATTSLNNMKNVETKSETNRVVDHVGLSLDQEYLPIDSVNSLITQSMKCCLHKIGRAHV